MRNRKAKPAGKIEFVSVNGDMDGNTDFVELSEDHVAKLANLATHLVHTMRPRKYSMHRILVDSFPMLFGLIPRQKKPDDEVLGQVTCKLDLRVGRMRLYADKALAEVLQ